MSSTQQKLDQIVLDKTAIKDAIEEKKGSSLVDPNNLGTYATEIDNLPNSGGLRPVEWLPMPSVNMNNEEKIVGLFMVTTNNDPDYNELVMTIVTTNGGTVHVDWGDGTIEDVASGKFSHLYNEADVTSDLWDGYKQVIVTITPTDLNDTIKTINFYNQINAQGERSVGFNEVVASVSNSTEITFRESSRLMYSTIGDLQNVTNMQLMYYLCFSLQSSTLGDLPSVSHMVRMYYGCSSLQSSTFGDLQSVTNMQQMYQGCSSLQSSTLGDLPKVTSIFLMYYTCYSLRSFTFGDLPKVTDGRRNFETTKSLEKLTLTNPSYEINLKNSGLSRTALVALFNSLPANYSNTITVTGCRGASGLSDADIAIVTGKNGTVVR